MALSFNNNREFFHSNHDWYVESVRKPLTELAYELTDTIELIDPNLERRPEKVVSRINRDLRFTKDKSPYRDYMWIGYEAQSENKNRLPGFYVGISAVGVEWGMGIYEENRPLMNANRQRLENDSAALDGITAELSEHFRLEASAFKRMKLPEGLNGIAAMWYPVRTFTFVNESKDMELITSGSLGGYLKRELLRLKPAYDYFSGLIPIE